MSFAVPRLFRCSLLVTAVLAMTFAASTSYAQFYDTQYGSGFVPMAADGFTYPQADAGAWASPEVNPVWSQGIVTQAQPLPVENTWPAQVWPTLALPHESSLPIEQPMIESTPQYVEQPAATDPFGGWSQIPEGYDPAYPIEHNGSLIEWGGSEVPALPNSQPALANGGAANGGAAEEGSPWISGVVIPGADADQESPATSADGQASNGSESDVVMPPVDAAKTDSSDQASADPATTGSFGELAESSDQTQVKSTAKTSAAADDEQAQALAELQREMQAIKLRAQQAEEKANAVAQQYAASNEQLRELKKQLAVAKRQEATINSQTQQARRELKRAQQQVAEAKRTAVQAERAAKMALAQAEKDRAVAQVAKNATQAMKPKAPAKATTPVVSDLELVAPTPAIKPETNEPTPAVASQPTLAAEPTSTAAVALDAPDASSAKSEQPAEPKPATPAAEDQPAAEQDKAADAKQTIRDKVKLLEAARDKQLKSTQERIVAEFQKKIDAKLDEGKTNEHPEVKSLIDAKQQRLEKSREKIRRRYQRQINRLWREKAAQARS